MAPPMVICGAPTKSGKPCGRMPSVSGLCLSHDPARREEFLEVQSRAAIKSGHVRHLEALARHHKRRDGWLRYQRAIQDPLKLCIKLEAMASDLTAEGVPCCVGDLLDAWYEELQERMGQIPPPPVAVWARLKVLLNAASQARKLLDGYPRVVATPTPAIAHALTPLLPESEAA